MKEHEAAADVENEAELEAAPIVPGKVLPSYLSDALPEAAAEPAEVKNSYFAQVTGFDCLDRLAREFGWRLLIVLFASQHLVKGFAASLLSPCSQFLFASFKVSGPHMQILGSVVSLPWSLKPVIGLISDAFPIGGYHKAPYIMATGAIGILASASVGLVPLQDLGLNRLVICLFCVQLLISTCDLLTEAKYAEKIQTRPQFGPALMAYVWFGIQASGLIATSLVGTIISKTSAKVPYLIAVLPMLLMLLAVLQGYLKEARRSPEEVQATRRRLIEQKEVCFLCLLMLLGSGTVTALGTLSTNTKATAAGVLIVALVLLVSFSVVLRPVIAKVNAFFLIQTALSLNINGAAFYFYTDGPEQFPEGPHFSKQFYTSVIGIVSAICAMLGTYTYQKYASEWSYRDLLLASNLALCFFNLADVVMFTHAHRRFGIPDHAFVLGSQVFQMTITQWQWMPGIVILSQLCPKGMEATMYALLAGCHNFGNVIASNAGALVLEILGCHPRGAEGESDQFKNLWICSALSTVLPLLTLVCLRWLIPDAKQTSKLMEDDVADATSGSLWRRWTGQ